MKRLCADDSADSRVKVGHRQANIQLKRPAQAGLLFLQVECLAAIAFRGEFFNNIQPISVGV